MSSALPRPRVLVVDDRPNMVRLVSKILRADAELVTADSLATATAALEDAPIQAIVSDLQLGDGTGLELLATARRLQPGVVFILMTAYATVDTAVEAMRLGAYDYLTKPFEPEELRALVLRALGRAAATSADEGETTEVLPGLQARSASMRALADLVQRFAPSEATALILGETGTGKERVARALHALSARADGPFVAVNCAAIPAELLESELFGHAEGAFTGARRARPGLFEEASGGTLFLDEIGELRSSLQAKLTRVLEERAVRRLGEAREREVDVRLVAATHRELERMVTQGEFREDLWYRLNVATLRLPPLRERPEDVELLAAVFLRELAARSPARGLTGFTPAAIEVLRACPWPGNVRQLRAAIERASLVATSATIDVADLPTELHTGGLGSELDDLGTLSWQAVQELARDQIAPRYLETLLRLERGNVTAAARRAGVERESFHRLMRRYGLEARDFRS